MPLSPIKATWKPSNSFSVFIAVVSIFLLYLIQNPAMKTRLLFCLSLFIILNNRLSSQTVSTVVGTLTAGYTDGAFSAAKFNGPNCVTIDKAGYLYVADFSNNVIRKIDLTNTTVSTLAGSTGGYQDGTAATAKFLGPMDLAIDKNNAIYVTDYSNQKVRKIFAGNVTTAAGSTAGYADGLGTAAQFFKLSGITADTINNNLYIADWFNYRIRKSDASYSITTIAGSATQGTLNGNGTAAQFNGPFGIDIDINGNIFIADRSNHNIRKIDPAGNVTTYAGTTVGYVDGPAATAKFDTPTFVAADKLGNVYVSDYGNNRIRKIDAGGNVSTIAGSAATGGYQDGVTAVSKLNGPGGLAVDKTGDLYFADYGNNMIRKITFCHAPDSPTLSVASNTICDGTPLNIIIAGALNSGQYWDAYTGNCGGSSLGTSNNATLTLTPSLGSNIYYLRGEGGCVVPGGCTTITITVIPSPTVNATTSTSLICSGQSVTLSATGANTYTWDTGSNSPVIVVSPTITTNYTVTGSGSNGCTNAYVITQTVSSCAGITNVNDPENQILISPNPFSSVFTIASPFSIEGITIMDPIGRKIFCSGNQSKTVEINIKDLAEGLYYIIITGQDHTYSSRIIKQ